MEKIGTILIGTPEFAARIFEKLKEVRLPSVDIMAVVTAPDKPVGRKQILTPSPVKKWALEAKLQYRLGAKLPILQPEKIDNPEWIEKIKKLKPDLIIATAYGQIISKEILDVPKYGALNIHPSLLSEYRGASPIQAAILNGDKETGVTIILMDEKMDHGPILASAKLQITNSQTYKELSEKLADLGADLLIKTLPDWINDKIKPKPQDHFKATFTKIIKKEDGKIDWNKSAEEIERQVRAFREWPTVYTFWNNKQLKILDAHCLKRSFKQSGEVFLDENKNLSVQTGDGILILKQVQLEGKRPMPAKDFLNGHPEIVGAIFRISEN